MRSRTCTNEREITRGLAADLNELNKSNLTMRTYPTALNRSPNAHVAMTKDCGICLNLFFGSRGYDLPWPVGRELTHLPATQGVVS